uniref:HAUS augmin-like complex subunit 8 n=1 Tax=Euleptes europaea TaxID=460621 RepID=UPI0025416D37|nr:HAUS augmin-like complex subunit 8 [Euleptes europaea]
MAEAAQGAKPKRGRIVPSRYLQYDRKTPGKAESAAKGNEKSAFAKRPPLQKSILEATSKNAVQSTFLEGHESARPNLELSTFLEGHESARPDLELSVVDKSELVKTLSKPNAASKGISRKEQALTSRDVDDLAGMLESQTLLLTYANVKMEKNLALLEAKAERDLLVLTKEREKLQEEVHRKKRKLLLLKKEPDLSNALDMQLEVLGPVVERCAKFQEEYKHFATALDSTRHELPLKGIHVGESQTQFLADLREHLAATERMLKQNLQEHLEHNAEALGAVRELEEASLKLADELPRSVASVLNLSADVSKEVSLRCQKTCEDTLGLEAMKQLYFP